MPPPTLCFNRLNRRRLSKPLLPCRKRPPPSDAPAQPVPEQTDGNPAPVEAESEATPALDGEPEDVEQPQSVEPQAAPPDASQAEDQAPPPLPEPERRPVRVAPGGVDGDAEMVVDEAEFIDTVVVSLAYVWLCCGIVLILVIPLIFLFLHIRGRSKIIKEEQF